MQARHQVCQLLLHPDPRRGRASPWATVAINIDPSGGRNRRVHRRDRSHRRDFRHRPRVALLSYSTKGSGKGRPSTRCATLPPAFRRLTPELKVDGELQFDAAVAPEVGQLKAPGSKVAGYANTFIFPTSAPATSATRLPSAGGFEAYGPILQGLNAPINDLSAAAMPRRSTRWP